jgi:serine/threonine protein phosphatase PrpC
VFLAIVADGVGRDTWGAEAARIAIEGLSQYCIHGIRCYQTGDHEHDRALVTGIHEAVRQSQANVAQRARENPGARGMSAALSMFFGSWPRAYVLLDGRNHCYRFLDGELAEVGAGLG